VALKFPRLSIFPSDQILVRTAEHINGRLLTVLMVCLFMDDSPRWYGKGVGGIAVLVTLISLRRHGQPS
jgi:hypothetical protein